MVFERLLHIVVSSMVSLYPYTRGLHINIIISLNFKALHFSVAKTFLKQKYPTVYNIMFIHTPTLFKMRRTGFACLQHVVLEQSFDDVFVAREGRCAVWFEGALLVLVQLQVEPVKTFNFMILFKNLTCKSLSYL